MTEKEIKARSEYRKNHTLILVSKETRDRLKIKAIKEGKPVTKMLEEFSLS